MKTYNEWLNESKVSVDVTPWQNTSGKKKPSGKGMWCFSSTKKCDLKNQKENEDYIFINADYGEAKKKAIEWAKEKGHNMIFTQG